MIKFINLPVAGCLSEDGYNYTKLIIQQFFNY